MISAYERGKRDPTLGALQRLLKAAGLDLRIRLEAADDHDSTLALLRQRATPAKLRRDAERVAIGASESMVASLDDVIRSKELAARSKDLQVLPALYRHQVQLRQAEPRSASSRPNSTAR